MRILSTSPRPQLRLDRLYENIHTHGSRFFPRSVRLHPTRSRVIALLSWIISLFSIATITCINLGGVSWPLATHDSPTSRLGNPGLELLQWLFDGPPPSTSIGNFYHYRLSLNRICAINPTKQRGYGSCYNAGSLGSFRFSQHSPDSYIAHERAYDAVLGRVDFFTPFLFYLIGGACCVVGIVLLPVCVVAQGAGEAGRRDTSLRTRAATAMFTQAFCFILASARLTWSIRRLAKWMQWIPQISHIWIGTVPLALTWTSTAASVIAALALLDDAALARRTLQDRRAGGSLVVGKRGRSPGRSLIEDESNEEWDNIPQSGREDKMESPWGITSPRKRLGRAATLGLGTPDVEAGSFRSLDLDDRPKLG